WPRIDFGQRLRSELERLGVPEKRLANLIEKSEPSVNSYCNARSLPPLDTLRQISSALRIPMDWLWPEDGNFPAFTQTPLWKLSELSKQLGNYIGDDAGLGKHRDRIVTLVPPRRRFVPVEVRSA